MNSWLDRTEYPFLPHYFYINGQRLHYIDEGAGETIVFIHGTPSWSFDFRNVIKELSMSFRCIAIDHIGFGLSSKPEHYDYSTINHCKTFEEFVKEKINGKFAMVVHDFGGPIGLNFAINNPEKVTGLTILNSWLWSSKAEPDFIKFSRLLKNPVLPFLYKHFNFSPQFIMPGSFGKHKLSKATRRQYAKPFADKTERYGVLGFLHSLLIDQDWFEELWERRDAISHKPTLFIWGSKDPVLSTRYLTKFMSGFPNHTVRTIETCGHFPQEENPVEVSEFLIAWMKEITHGDHIETAKTNTTQQV